MPFPSTRSIIWLGAFALCGVTIAVKAQQAPPSAPLHYRLFTITFAADGALSLEGRGWPAFKGTWKAVKDEVTIATTGGPAGCVAAGRYRFRTEGTQLLLTLVADDCVPRRMILHESVWLPQGEEPRVPDRQIGTHQFGHCFQAASRRPRQR